MARVIAKIAGGEWRENIQAEAWVGNAVAEAFGLNVNEPSVKADAKKMLKAWLASGVLAVEERETEHRKTKKFVVPGPNAPKV